MATKRARDLGFGAFVAGVTVLAMASAAFACTEIVGKVTIAGINGTAINGVSGGSVTYFGNGGDFFNSGESNGYCGGLPTSRTGVKPGTGPLHIRLSVASYTCSTRHSATTRVPVNGTWEVRWVKTQPAIDATTPYPVCHSDPWDPSVVTDPASRWVPLGTMTITNGSGSGDYALPATMVGPGNICVEKTDPASLRGELNPLTEDGSGGITPPVVFINMNLI